LNVKSKLRKARTFTVSDWLLLARAWAWLLVIDLGLRWLPFKTLHRRLALKRHIPALPKRDEDTVIRRVTLMVDRARRLHLYSMTCLRRSLALQRLLSGEGIATTLRFGVRPGAAGPARFQAHAWLERDGIAISEPEALAERYIALAGNPPGKDTL
jgi:hypothetical protein